MKETKLNRTKNTPFVHNILGISLGTILLVGMSFSLAFAQDDDERTDNAGVQRNKIAVNAEDGSQAEATTKDEDVNTLDGIIKAYYEVVSGPKGSIPDKERDLKIHMPNAQVIMMSGDGKGNVKANIMTVSEFHERNSKPRKTGFFEYEIKRETRQYGALTHIWSTYEWKATKDGPVGGRGINSIQLYNDGRRWWIAAEIFDIRNKPVPKQYMPE